MTKPARSATGAATALVTGAALVVVSAAVATGAHVLGGGRVGGVDVVLLVALVQVLLLALCVSHGRHGQSDRYGRTILRVVVLGVGQLAFHLALGSGRAPSPSPESHPPDLAGHGHDVHALEPMMLAAHLGAGLVLWWVNCRVAWTVVLLRHLHARLLLVLTDGRPVVGARSAPPVERRRARRTGVVAARDQRRRGPPSMPALALS